jgi:hypothetical protein
MKAQYIFLIISRSFLLKVENFSDKSCRGNQNTHFVVYNFFYKSSRLWDNVKKIQCRAGQVTYSYDKAHAYFTPST